MQTLARSVITSLTVVFTLLALFLFGGFSMRNFALALLVGIVSGTYSSIFNASQIVSLWQELEDRVRGRAAAGA
jgi:preprotein translocase subunit SecF